MPTAEDEQVVYLHGDLELKIIEVRRFLNSAADNGDGNQELNNLHPCKVISGDYYVRVLVPQSTLARTRIIDKNSQNLFWNDQFFIPLAHPVTELEFQLKAKTFLQSKVIGKAKIPAKRIATGKYISGWFRIEPSSCIRTVKALRLEMKFTPCETNPIYRNGIAGDPELGGVRNTYFPLRKGNQVTLYQDAHVREESLPHVRLEGDLVYKPGTCWEDICEAILDARDLIYIMGWSVFVKIKLVREPTRPLPSGGDLTLGELLKYKSQEGVRVLLLIWEDKTSHDKFGVKTAGLMATHGKETKRFFRDSSVNCVLAPRYLAGSKRNMFKRKIAGTIFTHHRKCVIVDTQASGNNRKITSFIGGIDLCDGRYDTPEHRLFRDLNTVFKDDFHNPSYPAGIKAPRQPWHDLHCRIEGPAAYDVLINFEQCWRQATPRAKSTRNFKKVSHLQDDSLQDDSLLKIERIAAILSPSVSVSSDGTTLVPQDGDVVQVSKEENPETWNVQIFRSIDSGSVEGFLKDVNKAENQNLICAKDSVIDKSIQMAYIQAIRSAQRFIYIENQYFLGSSYAWPLYKDAGADNLIPMELALKIASKIRANERFAVYIIHASTIIIPMWPEGDPNSRHVREILFWQSQTMQMMYSVVAQALKDMQRNAHPQDYLNFYCLGKREENLDVSTNSGEKVSESQKHKRFMVYVHAKGMIVADEYVIVGSANINQRSMAGSKDTEIAMGAYQPHHAWAKIKRHPHGQIYGYRNSLWAEHLGQLEASFEEPESRECVRTVNQIVGDKWEVELCVF
ncbi:phospholipase D delta-like [Pistacia vera]|uniref:phospholipase D delta-like n=1 Tax=Pistacia vera TaxID=55513 RepID=UPI00126328B7|nr:phospholipase D delta-like [Pistacia vera]